MKDNNINEYLPHRYPFLFIDKILKIKEYSYIFAIKNVTISEYFFLGHLPFKPIMPGVLIIESLAQLGGLLINISMNNKSSDLTFYLGSINKAKFKKIIVPGDQLYLEVYAKNLKKTAWKFLGKAFLNGKIISSAEITCIKYEK
ncbi:MAG TPA: 3-hydroxyacyl-ACP dehydratase FabZ [Candidatus Azoamicus sp. OHIO1]